MMQRIRELTKLSRRKREIQDEVSVSAATSKKIRLESQV